MENNAHKDAIDLLLDRYTGEVELGEDGDIRDKDKVLERVKSEKPGLFIERTEESDVKDANITSQPQEKSPSEMSMQEYMQWATQRDKNRNPL